MLGKVLFLITSVIPALEAPQGNQLSEWYCNCYMPGTRESEVGDLCARAQGGIIVSRGIVQCQISVTEGLPNPGAETFTDNNCEGSFGDGWRGQCATNSSSLDPGNPQFNQ